MNIMFVVLSIFGLFKLDLLPIKRIEKDKLIEIQKVSEAYYFSENGLVQKEIVKDENKYLFDKYLKKTYYVLAMSSNNDIYCVDNDGVVQTGLIKIENDTYYFDEKGIMQKGIININGKKYYFDINSGKLQYGFAEMTNGDIYYINSDGTIQIGFSEIEGNTYYFNNQGIMQKGIVNINEKNYLFDINSGQLQYGFTTMMNRVYYTNDNGIIQTGLISIGNDIYYFSDQGIMQTGWQTINGTAYYFKSDGKRANSTILINGDEYHFNASGILEYIRKTPVYYSQKDGRWAATVYGNGNMAISGCGPTSIAMVFSSLLGRSVLPTEIANYLYNYTNEFNKENIGMSGLAIQYAANYYGVSYTGISTLDQLNSELSKGNLVIGLVGSGHFVKPGYTHSIVLFESGGDVKVYNPNPTYSGSVRTTSASIVWNEMSNDAYDRKGGYLFYSFNR